VDRWTAAAGTGPGEAEQAQAVLASAEAGTGPLALWQHRLTAAVGVWQQAPDIQPGRILFSHLHMLHNRLGLGIADELLTYARLAPFHTTDPARSIR
jgi:hypothetical protein